MHTEPGPTPARLRRLSEELAEAGFSFDSIGEHRELLLAELDYALRPAVFERREPTFGSMVAPTIDPDRWSQPTELVINRRDVSELSLADARRFADGLSSWLVRRDDGGGELVIFDRPAGSERDLVVLSEATGGPIVQRHPTGWVRAVGEFGVLRWDGMRWHHEAPLAAWIDTLALCDHHGDRDVLTTLLEFAVHDLGSRGIGALLVYRPAEDHQPFFEIRLAEPPPLQICRASDLAPLRHVLGQIDGAAVFDEGGTLRQLGVRLVPSALAESDVEGYRGMRHTSARRYSFDDPVATVVVVSEDGPVTVLRRGQLVGRSNPS